MTTEQYHTDKQALSAAPGESRQIGVIRFDKHKHPYAVLQTCSDGKGNAWVAETPIYAGQAPQQEAQEPAAWLVPTLQTFKGAERVHFTRAPGCIMTDAELIDHMEGRVVWIAKTISDSPGITDKFGVKHKPKPLYTAPQPAPAPLTNEQKLDLLSDCKGAGGRINGDAQLFSLIEQVERAHGITQKGGSNAE